MPAKNSNITTINFCRTLPDPAPLRVHRERRERGRKKSHKKEGGRGREGKDANYTDFPSSQDYEAFWKKKRREGTMLVKGKKEKKRRKEKKFSHAPLGRLLWLDFSAGRNPEQRKKREKGEEKKRKEKLTLKCPNTSPHVKLTATTAPKREKGRKRERKTPQKKKKGEKKTPSPSRGQGSSGRAASETVLVYFQGQRNDGKRRGKEKGKKRSRGKRKFFNFSSTQDAHHNLKPFHLSHRKRRCERVEKRKRGGGGEGGGRGGSELPFERPKVKSFSGLFYGENHSRFTFTQGGKGGKEKGSS